MMGAKVQRYGWVIFFLGFAGCGPSGLLESSSRLTATAPVGQLRGYAVLNDDLRVALFAPGSPGRAQFRLGPYFGEEETYFNGLGDLLGAVTGQGMNNAYRNGHPNATNTLLWYMAMAGVAADLAKVCAADAGVDVDVQERYRLATWLRDRVAAVCRLPQDPVQQQQVTQSLWLALVGYSAPRSEMAAWQVNFLDANSPWLKASPTERVQAMLTAALLNPYFLLEHGA